MKDVLPSCRLSRLASDSMGLLPVFGQAVQKLTDDLLKEKPRDTPLSFVPPARRKPGRHNGGSHPPNPRDHPEGLEGGGNAI
jgi:hypothetical protein